jgi:SWI/SNF-related matrix-associated actin-dependent regulator of chromatin subfamily A containing DEAD/H box 1
LWRIKTFITKIHNLRFASLVQTISFLAWLQHQSKAPAGSRNAPVSVDDDDDFAEGGALSGEDDDSDHQDSHLLSADDGPHIVVAPSSVISNWEREFHSFAPQLKVLKYHGSQEERLLLQDQLMGHLPSRSKARQRGLVDLVDVVLVPINYFQKEKSDDRVFLRKINYNYLVLDEAHVLKNAKGLGYKSLDRFKTKHRLLLTGTPVQNSPKELMSLLCFLMPLFSHSNFGESVNDGGESMLEHFVTLQGKHADGSEKAYKKLKQLFAPFVLRRKKEDVLSQILPPKIRKDEFVSLDEQSRSIYNGIIENHIQSKNRGESAFARDHLFTQLRKAAHHSLLLRTRYLSPDEKEHLTHWFHLHGAFRGSASTKERVAAELEKFNDFDIHVTALQLIQENSLRREHLQRYVLDEEDLFRSAKFSRLRTLLPDIIADGHRVLIFSVWTSCLGTSATCHERHYSFSFCSSFFP